MLSNTDKAYMSIARYLASKSGAKNQHGAIIVRGGRVLGTGFNKNRNNPVTVSPEHIQTYCSYHAEVVAIKDASKSDMAGAIMYTARVNRNGIDRNSKPCPRCAMLIESMGIKRVVFTTTGE